jgi:toxin-antitoxin system PIN domain toxin
MRALLDVNVLIALLDQTHQHHDRATAWLTAHGAKGWASCPITQNGFVRIMSQPGYVRPIAMAQAIELLAAACAGRWHAFWPDDVSVLDPLAVDGRRIHGPRQLTDIYLLALAVRHGGRLATFDDSIPVSAVRGARREHMAVI